MEKGPWPPFVGENWAYSPPPVRESCIRACYSLSKGIVADLTQQVLVRSDDATPRGLTGDLITTTVGTATSFQSLFLGKSDILTRLRGFHT